SATRRRPSSAGGAKPPASTRTSTRSAAARPSWSTPWRKRAASSTPNAWRCAARPGGSGRGWAGPRARPSRRGKSAATPWPRFGDAENRWRAESDALAAQLERAVQRHDEADRRGRDLQARLELLGAEVDSLRQGQARLRQDLAAREQEVEAARDAAREAQDRL